jgi:hypothetical protein
MYVSWNTLLTNKRVHFERFSQTCTILHGAGAHVAKNQTLEPKVRNPVAITRQSAMQGNRLAGNGVAQGFATNLDLCRD